MAEYRSSTYFASKSLTSFDKLLSWLFIGFSFSSLSLMYSSKRNSSSSGLVSVYQKGFMRRWRRELRDMPIFPTVFCFFLALDLSLLYSIICPRLTRSIRSRNCCFRCRLRSCFNRSCRLTGTYARNHAGSSEFSSSTACSLFVVFSESCWSLSQRSDPQIKLSDLP